MAEQYQNLVNKQYNSPINLYSDRNVREILERETRVLSNGAVGIDFNDPRTGKPSNLQNSAVLRMLEEEESRKRSGQPGSLKRVAWPPPQDDDSEIIIQHEPVQAQGGPLNPSKNAPSGPQGQHHQIPVQQTYSPQQQQQQFQYQQQQTQYQQQQPTNIKPVSPIIIGDKSSPLQQPSPQQTPTTTTPFSPVRSPASPVSFTSVAKPWSPQLSPNTQFKPVQAPSAASSSSLSYQSSRSSEYTTTTKQQYQYSSREAQEKRETNQPTLIYSTSSSKESYSYETPKETQTVFNQKTESTPIVPPTQSTTPFSSSVQSKSFSSSTRFESSAESKPFSSSTTSQSFESSKPFVSSSSTAQSFESSTQPKTFAAPPQTSFDSSSVQSTSFATSIRSAPVFTPAPPPQFKEQRVGEETQHAKLVEKILSVKIEETEPDVDEPVQTLKPTAVNRKEPFERPQSQSPTAPQAQTIAQEQNRSDFQSQSVHVQAQSQIRAQTQSESVQYQTKSIPQQTQTVYQTVSQTTQTPQTPQTPKTYSASSPFEVPKERVIPIEIPTKKEVHAAPSPSADPVPVQQLTPPAFAKTQPQAQTTTAAQGVAQNQPQQRYQTLPKQAKPVEPPPSTITLRPQAPVSQAPPPLVSSQPATATLKGGKNLRGDLKWPPEDVREKMEAEKQHLMDLAKGPAVRPRKNCKDYSSFFAKHALTHAYPGYKIPPGTQFYDHNPVM